MIDFGGWRFALASAEGTSHSARGMPCQDAADCRVLAAPDGEALVAVVSDGAGSAAHAEVGARLACQVTLEEVAEHFDQGLTTADVTEEDVKGWLAVFADRVRMLAEEEGHRPRDYACTLLGAIVAEGAAVFFQVGDGAIVVSSSDAPDGYGPVFWPERGEYANETYFATADDAGLRLRFESRSAEEPAGRVEEVALLSDGLQALALQYQTRSAHLPFFRPIFGPVRAAPPGPSESLSAALTRFLGSPRVNERTDDDKTLVLATRRAAPSATGPAPAAEPEQAPAACANAGPAVTGDAGSDSPSDGSAEPA